MERHPLSRVFLPALLLTVLMAAIATAMDGSGPVWPLDLETRYLTSNFMEYRPGRFHAGLDFKTNSSEGYAARAVEDGWILRVRATPGAYGRAIYLRGVSGRTFVYAHLSRFNDPIRARVREQQEKSGRYRTRITFREGEMPVKAGEVLGLTGQSGTSGPHLHFEVRDEDNRPVNPLEHGFAVDDRLAPVIHAVRAVPVTPAARIGGVSRARVLEGPLSGEQPPLHLVGPVAFAVKIVDASDRAGHKLEPWLIEARLDGELVYSCRNDVFDFAESSLQRLEWLEVPGIRDRWLHRRPANTLTGREGGLWHLGPEGAGLPAGDHELRISASDHAGNTVVATIPLVVRSDSTAAAKWIVDPVAVMEDALSNGLVGNRLTPFFEDLGEGCDWEVVHLDPAAGAPVHAPTRLATRPVVLDSPRLEKARSQGLTVLGGAVEFAAADWPISASVEVPLPGSVWAGVDSLGDHRGPAPLVYRWTRRGWRPAGAVMGTGGGAGRLSFRLHSPGLHAVFADGAAPVIDGLPEPFVVAPSDSTLAHGVTLPRWRIFPVLMDDAGSGVATGTISVLLDGAALVVEPDLIRDRILVELPDATAPGRHELVVMCADKAGNEALRTIVLECREDPEGP